MNKKKWDIFLSHATEDKETIARPLYMALQSAGVRVWFDEHELQLGDSLSEKIDEGLSQSRFGVVILSPSFLGKHWPKKELAGLRAREENGHKVILPVWHDVDKSTIREFSPILSDILAANTAQGIDNVVAKLLNVIFVASGNSLQNPTIARRFIEILESQPTKKTLVDFLRAHLPRIGRYIDWGSTLICEKREFDGMEFDAYASYVGHGIRLTLVTFTEIWSDIYEMREDGVLHICQELMDTISKIRDIQYRFKNDIQAQRDLKYFLAVGHHDYERMTANPYFESVIPDIWFFIFAGRRSVIDSSSATHDAWSQLLIENGNLNIKTYDFILDAFLTMEGNK